MFILRAFARRAGLGLAPGEHAPAVILPVQAVPGGQLGAALEAVFLFEIRRQPAHAILRGKRFSQFTQPNGVFVRADGQRGGEIIVSARRRGLCSAAQAQPVAFIAAAPALGDVLQPFHGRVKFRGRVRLRQNIHRAGQRHLLHKAGKLPRAVGVFLRGVDVGIVVVRRDGKMGRKIFQHIAGTGRAAAVQQQAGRFALVFLQFTFQLQLIIHSHATASFPV